MKNLMLALTFAVLVLPATAGAQEVRVRFVFQSPSVGLFEHQVTVSGPASYRLNAPTQADLKPYLIVAQKALAEREGYSEKLYGANHYTLASGRLVEASVWNPEGRKLYSSKEPVENDDRDQVAAKPARAIKLLDTGADDASVGFAPVPAAPSRTSHASDAPVRSGAARRR